MSEWIASHSLTLAATVPDHSCCRSPMLTAAAEGLFPCNVFAAAESYLRRTFLHMKMINLVRPVLLVGSLLACAVIPTAARDEFIALSESRKINITVPDGFNYASGKNAEGVPAFTLADAKGRMNLSVTFLPDPEGKYSSSRARKELMNDTFNEYVGGSVEHAMQFEELAPKIGAGTYCVFTDAKLAGKAPYPPGEFLHVTTGVKTWPGVVATFTLFSDDTTSQEYHALMKTLRESVDEKPVPMK